MESTETKSIIFILHELPFMELSSKAVGFKKSKYIAPGGNSNYYMA